MVPWRYGRRGAVLVAATVLLVARPVITMAQVVVPPPKPLPTAPTTAPPFIDATTTAPPPPTTTTATTTPATTAPPPTTTTATTAPTASTTTAPGATTTTTTTGGATVTTVTTAGTSTTTTSTSVAARSGPPPPSLSESAANAYLSGLARNPGPDSSTNALLAALRPLQDYGLTKDQVVASGFGRFPVGGEAYFRDDFGDPRDDPEPHTHQGNDIFSAFGTPVRAPANGVVTFTNELVGGKCAYVTEPDGTWYYLAHLRGFAPGVNDGATVKAGDVIGFNGDTGNAQGGPPHVHFEVHPRGGAAVSPKPYLDAWLADALAAVPELMLQYTGGHALTGPLAAIGIARHLDLGVMAGTPRDLTPEPGFTAEEIADALADALVDPLTPPVLLR